MVLYVPVRSIEGDLQSGVRPMQHHNKVVLMSILFLILFYAFLSSGYKKPKTTEVKYMESQPIRVIKERPWYEK